MNISRNARRWLLTLALLAVPSAWVIGQDAPQTYSPRIAAASEEPQKALAAIRVPAGHELTVFAAEPMLANPVAFAIDERNRFYVAETFRLHAGVTDNRNHMKWLDDDLACRTVEDRVAMYQKWLNKETFASYGVEHDRVRLIEDRDGDGRADHDSVFADGFNGAASGLGAGLLARKGDVYFTCIPDLWLLRDTQGVGRADVRKALHTGYGVHVAFLGHDLHGLKFGPDGKLYFSVGDRGLNVKTGGRHLELPDTGAVLRCDPDGSNLELFATGLRNPQELAFDEFGNLFTVDNNSDGGDKARLVHVVEGGDSGWRMGYQYLERPYSRGPWNAEKLWHPLPENTASYLLPPLANLGDGPSGLVYDPGTGLTERSRHQFYLCDFRGAAATSGIRSFTLKPRGASFELAEQEQFVWGAQATDVDFGTDGALYFSDWVQGWGLTGKGRIYRLAPPGLGDDADVREVKSLLAEGFDSRPLDELARRLSHRDARVRQGAQFALADKGSAAIATLQQVARQDGARLARLHAIWGLGQIGRKDAQALESLPGLLADRDDEVRAQAARVLGDARVGSAFKLYVPMLHDSSPRVRFYVAMALGKLGKREAVAPVLQMLRDEANQDVYLRHAAVMALFWSGDVDSLIAAAKDASPAVRLGVLLALRRLESPEVARFLDDADPALVLEAARAIHDVPIVEAMPRLATLITRAELPEPLARRVLDAQARGGRPENARALAAYAVRNDAPDRMRVEALDQLAAWPKPSGRDRIVGLWRPIAPRPAIDAAVALSPGLNALLSQAPDPVRRAAARASGSLGESHSGPALLALVRDAQRPNDVRLEALQALERRPSPELTEAANAAANAAPPELRSEGLRIVARTDPRRAVEIAGRLLEEGSTSDRQAAFAALGDIAGTEAEALLGRGMERLLAGDLPLAVQVDLLEASARRSTPALQAQLQRYEAGLAADDPLAAFRPALAGGNAERGRAIFLDKTDVYCLRCHKVDGNGGEVGPDLTGLGAKQDRSYLLEAIVLPAQRIAEGFESVTVATTEGQVLSGVLKGEDGKTLRLMTAEAKLIEIPKEQIEERTRGGSAMPEDLVKKLTKSELRDLVEFLSELKTPPNAHEDDR